MPFTKAEAIKISFPEFQVSMDANDKEIIHIFLQFQSDMAYFHVDTDIKILSAIHKTANLVGVGDTYIAKVLVDFGLCAPRSAFPEDFLDHIDNIRIRSEQVGVSLLSESYKKLVHYWTMTGEEPVAFTGNPVPTYIISSSVSA